MNLFDNDVINISRIFSINKYVACGPKDVVRYSTDLKAYELIFFVSGGSDTRFSDVDIKDSENSLRYLPKGSFDGEYIVKNIKPGYCIDIYFDTEDDMPDKAIGFQNMEFLRDKFIKIYNIWTEKAPDYYINSMMLFYDIIRCVKKSQNCKYIDAHSRNRIYRAYEYILKNYKSSKFDYNKLCDETGFSSSYFREVFVAEYNMSPVKLVTKMKIDYAKELLVTNRYSISEIADMCGFDNVYYFSNVFKKWTGIRPSEYRKTI